MSNQNVENEMQLPSQSLSQQDESWNQYWFERVLQFGNSLEWQNLSQNAIVTMDIIKENPDAAVNLIKSWIGEAAA